MPRKTQEFEIDGHLYQVQQVGAETGDAILFRLGRGLAMSDLKPEDFEYVRNVFRGSTKLQIVDTKGDGRKTWVPLASCYDDHFAGRYEAVAEWLKAVFELNFGPFVAAVTRIVGTRAAVLNSLFPTAVPGASGDSSPANTSASEASQS
jgi:hypothetical protein